MSRSFSQDPRRLMGVRGAHPHYNLAEYNIFFPEVASYYHATVIRNPWDRLVSEYHWMTKLCPNKKSASPFKIKAHEEFSKISFDTFCELYWKVIDINDPRHRFSQSWYVPSLGDFDYVGRFENFPEILQKVEELTGKKSSEELHCHNNQRKNRKPYWEYYSEKTLSIIEKEWGDDIASLGYTFGQEDGKGTY